MNFDGTFTAYQEIALRTAVYPGQGAFLGLTYATLGLAGEAGETVEQVKKTWRDDVSNLMAPAGEFQLSEERREKIKKELGDVLWYAAQLCTELGIPMSEVAGNNIRKIAARKAADKLYGEGSDR